MTDFVNGNEGVFGIDCIDDQLIITITDPANNVNLRLEFPLDTAIDVCRAIIYYTCSIGNGNNISEIINKIIGTDRPLFNTPNAMH